LILKAKSASKMKTTTLWKFYDVFPDAGARQAGAQSQNSVASRGVDND
jgi:hypothetical protein